VRNGDEESAVGDLIGLAGEASPALIDAFRAEPDAGIRAVIVRVVWERREESAIALLQEALSDPTEEVWQEALNGSIALASPQILELLTAARTREWADQLCRKRFLLYIDEAILYLQGLLRANPRLK
jgi:HEAT repeat protein